MHTILAQPGSVSTVEGASAVYAHATLACIKPIMLARLLPVVVACSRQLNSSKVQDISPLMRVRYANEDRVQLG